MSLKSITMAMPIIWLNALLPYPFFSIETKINLTSYKIKKNIYRSKNRKLTVKCRDAFPFKSMPSNKFRFSKETHKTSTCTKRYSCGRATIPPFGRVILVLKTACLVTHSFPN